MKKKVSQSLDKCERQKKKKWRGEILKLADDLRIAFESLLPPKLENNLLLNKKSANTRGAQGWMEGTKESVTGPRTRGSIEKRGEPCTWTCAQGGGSGRSYALDTEAQDSH